MKKGTSIKHTNSGSIAIQVDGKGHTAVGIGNLRVLIIQDEDCWYAQGIEIDYGAQGDTPAEAKSHFEAGLFGTIDLNIKTYGSLDPILKFASDSILKEASKNRSSIYLYAQISAHEIPNYAQFPDALSQFPFTGIEYLSSEYSAV